MVHGKYTITLDSVISSGFDLNAFKNYPIFDETYRETLNKKIIEHYRFYEIGFETPMMFNQRLYARLLDVMAYFNQLYEIELIKNNIGLSDLVNVQYRELVDQKTVDDTNTDFTGREKKGGKDTEDIVKDGYIQYGRTKNNTGFQDTLGRRDNFLHSTTNDNTHYTNDTTNRGFITNETATLTAETPQSQPTITHGGQGSTDLVGFDTFNHEVFEVDGYVSQGDKSLNVTEDKSGHKVEYTSDGIINRDDTGYYTDNVHRTDNLLETLGGTDLHHDDITDTKNYDSTRDNDDNTKTLAKGNLDSERVGNHDYLESIRKAREQCINIDLQIIESLNILFLQVF